DLNQKILLPATLLGNQSPFPFLLLNEQFAALLDMAILRYVLLYHKLRLPHHLTFLQFVHTVHALSWEPVQYVLLKQSVLRGEIQTLFLNDLRKYDLLYDGPQLKVSDGQMLLLSLH